MSDNFKYKPHLPKEKEYLEDVARTISERAPLEEIKFEYLTDVLGSLDFSGNPYEFVSLENLNPESLQSLVEKSFLKINSIKLTDDIKEKLFRLWDYLSESDSLEQSDLIFVFGGPGLQRVNEAVGLYKEGRANRILFTGRMASYMKDIDVTEAEYYAGVAKDQGVPTENIILETEAKNTPENAANSIKILKTTNFLPSKVILVTIAYHMRRSYLTFKSAADWNPKLIRHPVASEKYTKENYFLDKNGWSYVFFEYIKIYGARLMKHF